MGGRPGMEKVTFNIPTELKEQVIALKEDLQISLSAIYNEAIANYLKQKEIEKWRRGVSMALEDKEYLALASENSRPYIPDITGTCIGLPKRGQSKT